MADPQLGVTLVAQGRALAGREFGLRGLQGEVAFTTQQQEGTSKEYPPYHPRWVEW